MTIAESPLIRVLRFGHARFANLKLDLLSEGIADNVEWYTPGNHPLSGKVVGLEGVRDWMARSAEMTNGTFRADIHRILAEDDFAAVVSTYRGERKGIVLEMPGVQTFRADPVTGKVVEARIWVYDDVFVNRFWSA